MVEVDVIEDGAGFEDEDEEEAAAEAAGRAMSAASASAGEGSERTRTRRTRRVRSLRATSNEARLSRQTTSTVGCHVDAYHPSAANAPAEGEDARDEEEEEEEEAPPDCARTPST